jgi:two-component system sensor histidine kinase GlrK
VKIGRPRTLLGLILVGIGLLTLPLLVGVGNAVFELGALADESAAVVSESVTATLENQRVARLLTELERNAQGYLALGEQQRLTFYETDNASLQESLAVLARLPPQTSEMRAEIATLRNASMSVLNVLLSRPTESRSNDIDAGFRRMNSAASSVATGMRVFISERLNTLEETTRTAQRALAWQAAALIPGTLLLVVFFVFLIGRPMRQVDRAIRELGKGDFGNPISVTGPTDIETLGRQLEWLRNRLKESTDEKNKFLRHMSHELKTPLANIREGTELLLDGAVGRLDNQQQEVTGILRENSLKLQKLIENLLTFSAWQTKTAELKLTEFDLKPLVFSVLSQHRLVISNRKIKLAIDVKPMSVRADEGKLKLVLENLVSNALKFTPDSGTIGIKARMQGTQLVVDVTDDGPGVAPEDAPRIFEAFYQGRRPQGGAVGGTGIGLSVVQECIQAHGGAVELINGATPGAHFQVRLPLRRVSDKPVLVVNNG